MTAAQQSNQGRSAKSPSPPHSVNIHNLAYAGPDLLSVARRVQLLPDQPTQLEIVLLREFARIAVARAEGGAR